MHHAVACAVRLVFSIVVPWKKANQTSHRLMIIMMDPLIESFPFIAHLLTANHPRYDDTSTNRHYGNKQEITQCHHLPEELIL
jgi:hypothetical protein